MTLTAWLSPVVAAGQQNATVFSFGSSTMLGGGAAVMSQSTPWVSMVLGGSLSSVTLTAATSSAAGAQSILQCTGLGLSAGSWAHLAMTVQGTGAGNSGPVEMTLYLNGVSQACSWVERGASSTLGMAWRTGAFLGQGQSVYDGHFGGYIGDMQARWGAAGVPGCALACWRWSWGGGAVGCWAARLHAGLGS